MSPSMLDDGVYYDVSRDRYDAIDRANFSTLKYFEKSPKHYLHNKEANKSGKTGKPKDALLIGNALHIKVFEPETFERRVIRWDGKTRQGNEWDAFAEEYKDRVILTVAGWDAVDGMAEAIRAEEPVQKYLTGGAGEMTLLFTLDTSDGEPIKMKMRVDFDCDLALVDLKSSSRYEPVPFGFQAENLHYDAQSAIYTDGYKIATGIEKPYRLVVVESSEPHDVVVYRVTKPSFRNGRDKYQRWLDAFAFHHKHKTWPGVSGGAELDLFVPGEPDTEEQETLGSLTSGGKPLHLERD